LKTAARFEVELPVMPVTDKYAIPKAAFRHRVTHMRTAIINRVEFTLKLEDGEVSTIDMIRFAFKFLKVISTAQLVVD
jgi:hypothetical protein